MTAVSGTTTSAISVSFQFSSISPTSRPATTSVSRTNARNTELIMSTTWRTSPITVLMILPVDSSWKRATGRRSRRSNTMPRRSLSTRLMTQLFR